MPKTTNKVILNLILLFSIFALLAAYFIQYILGHEPCNLCLIERIPYIISIILITLNFIIKKYEKILLIFLTTIFSFATFISFYHLGIEQELISESFVCNLSNENILSKEEILNELNKKIISCKDVYFKIFGLSLASINTLFSLTLSAITLKLFLNYEKN
jgi:disulfide bond formation protein DsbB